MWANESHKERSKNRMYSDDTSEEGRGKHHEHRQTHYCLTGAIGEASGTSQYDDEDWSDCVDEE